MPLRITEVTFDSTSHTYIEITNVSGSNVDLSDYRLGFSELGTTSVGSNILDPVILAPGESYVVGHSAGTLYNVDQSESAYLFTNDTYGYEYDAFILYPATGSIFAPTDLVGDYNSSVSLIQADTSYQATGARTADTNVSDDFTWAGSGFTQFSSADHTLGSPTVSCFLAGTMIASTTGEIPVESLSIGDLVSTENGKKVAVRWVGRQTVSRLRHGQNMQPVRIRAGALGGGLPHTDLTVTADHGMVIEGLVINASALINGTTIDWVPMAELGDTFTVYHIETENHDVILANGAPSETFIDYRDRAAFDNHQEYLDLYGAERIIPELPMPRISTARLVPDAVLQSLGSVSEHDKKARLSA